MSETEELLAWAKANADKIRKMDRRTSAEKAQQIKDAMRWREEPQRPEGPCGKTNEKEG